mmetsp:Transcript_8117/g.26833  ORF Transcript_8117/g.26833 Transcript_8117/m.26833 type:complete len:475 (+) Transcript_8117:17-1441(+)
MQEFFRFTESSTIGESAWYATLTMHQRPPSNRLMSPEQARRRRLLGRGGERVGRGAQDGPLARAEAGADAVHLGTDALQPRHRRSEAEGGLPAGDSGGSHLPRALHHRPPPAAAQESGVQQARPRVALLAALLLAHPSQQAPLRLARAYHAAEQRRRRTVVVPRAALHAALRAARVQRADGAPPLLLRRQQQQGCPHQPSGALAARTELECELVDAVPRAGLDGAAPLERRASLPHQPGRTAALLPAATARGVHSPRQRPERDLNDVIAVAVVAVVAAAPALLPLCGGGRGEAAPVDEVRRGAAVGLGQLLARADAPRRDAHHPLGAARLKGDVWPARPVERRVEGGDAAAPPRVGVRRGERAELRVPLRAAGLRHGLRERGVLLGERAKLGLDDGLELRAVEQPPLRLAPHPRAPRRRQHREERRPVGSPGGLEKREGEAPLAVAVRAVRVGARRDCAEARGARHAEELLASP